MKNGRNISTDEWEFEDKIYCLLPSDNMFGKNLPSNNSEWDLYLVDEFRLVIDKSMALRHDKPALAEYMALRQTMATVIMQHGARVERWYYGKITDLRKERRETIYKKMRDMGWDEVYYPKGYPHKSTDAQVWQNIMDQSKPLTEKSWPSIRRRLEEIYQRSKAQYLQRLANTESLMENFANFPDGWTVQALAEQRQSG